MPNKLVKKDPYTEIMYWSPLKCHQQAREIAFRELKLRKTTPEAVCAELELPEKKIKHWLDYKKKLILSKAPRDRDLMILLRYLGYDITLTLSKCDSLKIS